VSLKWNCPEPPVQDCRFLFCVKWPGIVSSDSLAINAVGTIIIGAERPECDNFGATAEILLSLQGNQVISLTAYRINYFIPKIISA
jgi:hypothetical protein